jgi:hypothetical protein
MSSILSKLINLAGNITGTLGISNGGTNSSTSLNNNRVMKSSGGAIIEAAAITATRALVSDSNGIPIASATTQTQLEYLQSATGTTGTTSTNLVFSTSPTFVTPVLGTPASGTLTNCTSVKGITTGSAVAAGIIGEVISTTAQGASTTIGTTATQIATVSLTAGVWLINYGVNVLVTNAATNDGSFALGTTASSYSGTTLGYDQFNIYTLALNGRMAGWASKVLSIGSTTSYYLNCISRQGTAAQGDWLGSIIALRVG